MRLALWSGVALIVFRAIDTSLYDACAQRWPTLALLADLRIPSLVFLAIAYASTRDVVSLWSNKRPDARTGRLVLLWLAGTFVFVHFTGLGKVALPRWEDRVAFFGTGLCAEELVCRGLVLCAALAIWPSGWRAISWSAATFSLAHLQYHHFHATPAALAQLAWTLPLGVVLATVAVRTRSLVAAMLLHVATNVLAFFA